VKNKALQYIYFVRVIENDYFASVELDSRYISIAFLNKTQAVLPSTKAQDRSIIVISPTVKFGLIVDLSRLRKDLRRSSL
jgi:hypothetical protein